MFCELTEHYPLHNLYIHVPQIHASYSTSHTPSHRENMYPLLENMYRTCTPSPRTRTPSPRTLTPSHNIYILSQNTCALSEHRAEHTPPVLEHVLSLSQNTYPLVDGLCESEYRSYIRGGMCALFEGYVRYSVRAMICEWGYVPCERLLCVM